MAAATAAVPGGVAAAASGPPVITGLTPPAGAPGGGDTVTIAGSGLSKANAVHFGAAVSRQITVVSSTRIQVVTPQHALGTVAVRVHTARGDSPRTDKARFTYADPPAPLDWSSPETFDPPSLLNGYQGISCASRDVCIADPVALNSKDAVAPVMRANGSWQRAQLPPSAAGTFTRSDGAGCPMPTMCLVVGWSGTSRQRQPTAWTWDGSDWSMSLVEAAVTQSGAWSRPVCARLYAFCMVADPEGVTRIFDAGQWTTPPQQFTPIACATDTFCIVRDSSGYSVWNGRVATPSNDPFSYYVPFISCVSASFCLAIGTQGTQIQQWTFDGTTWSTADVTNVEGYPTAPVCFSETSCVLVDYTKAGSRAELFDGQSWTPGGRVSTRRQTALSCWSADGCRSVDRAAIIATLEGDVWRTAQPIPRTGQPTDISCAAATACVAVDATGHALRFDGTTWQAPEGIDVRRELVSVSCSTPDDCMAIDARGYAVRLSRGRWHQPTHVLPIDNSYDPLDISCASARFCVVVAQDGRAAVYRDGRWRATPRNVAQHGNALVSVSCSSPHHCLAAGAGIAVYNGHWGDPLAGNHYFYGLSCADGVCAALSGYVWIRSGEALARQDIQASGRVVCATGQYCLVSGPYNAKTGTVVDGAVSADAGIPDSPFAAADCTAHFCMLLVGPNRDEETHASL